MAQPLKPPCLRPGDEIRVVSLSSPVKDDLLQKGCEELKQLGFAPMVDRASVLACDGTFAGPHAARLAALKEALQDPGARAIFCSRGGYGANYLLDGLGEISGMPKILVGASDITSLQVFLWQKFRWVTFYGPMIATNINRGAGATHGYDRESLLRAVMETKQGWTLDLPGEPLVSGVAEGPLLGGCLTLVETTLGTPWELDTQGSILLLEDRGMKPYQVDRALMHLKQAGKLKGIVGIILGDFPECEPPAGGEDVKAVAERVLSSVGVPIVWGSPIGHTSRAALTLPLGVHARLTVAKNGAMPTQLEILEAACAP
jgi:muramoyltetrapeptide carboxypeptidase